MSEFFLLLMSYHVANTYSIYSSVFGYVFSLLLAAVVWFSNCQRCVVTWTHQKSIYVQHKSKCVYRLVQRLLTFIFHYVYIFCCWHYADVCRSGKIKQIVIYLLTVVMCTK